MRRLNQTQIIAWELRVLGQLFSRITNDGDGPMIQVWVNGAKDSEQKDIKGEGPTMDEAMRSLWKQLTASGSYVTIGNYRHVYGRGIWQAILE